MNGGTLMFAPIGTDDWQDLGHVQVGLDVAADCSDAFVLATKMGAWSSSVTYENNTAQAFAALAPAMRRATVAMRSLTVTSLEDSLPPPPTKRRGLTGKAYRIARRRHARRRRAWVRAGRPLTTVMRHFPNLRHVSTEPVGDGTFSVGFEVAGVPRPSTWDLEVQ